MSEVKAYDVNRLVERLKDKGLDIAEEAAAVLVQETLEWVKESALASENSLDDIFVGLIPTVQAYIMSQIDRIDGEDDPGR